MLSLEGERANEAKDVTVADIASAQCASFRGNCERHGGTFRACEQCGAGVVRARRVLSVGRGEGTTV
eukprot:1660306-Pleurochrysis_carterae.AAC.1